jgi:hypothetical protein
MLIGQRLFWAHGLRASGSMMCFRLIVLKPLEATSVFFNPKEVGMKPDPFKYTFDQRLHRRLFEQ